MMEQSIINKSQTIKDFRLEIKKKPPTIAKRLDEPFFLILNRIYRRKPLDIKFHISDFNSLIFNITLSNDQVVFLEHFLDRIPNTILSCKSVIPFSDNDMCYDDLNIVLDYFDTIGK